MRWIRTMRLRLRSLRRRSRVEDELGDELSYQDASVPAFGVQTLQSIFEQRSVQMANLLRTIIACAAILGSAPGRRRRVRSRGVSGTSTHARDRFADGPWRSAPPDVGARDQAGRPPWRHRRRPRARRQPCRLACPDRLRRPSRVRHRPLPGRLGGSRHHRCRRRRHSGSQSVPCGSDDRLANRMTSSAPGEPRGRSGCVSREAE
jgi:hypothetical protein